MIDDPRQGGEELHRSPEPESKKSAFAKREEAVLAFWNERDIFNKSLAKHSPQGEFVFYDGPPFATGLPHYGHLLAGSIKDAIPRYKTMRGFHVPRRWGWDCHGLPLENQIEQELGLKTKRQIEQLGIGKFNEAARSAVLRYAEDWKRIIPRMGRFVDMEHDYKTMDPTYTESVWWAFKRLYDKGLIYEGFKSMQYCPRCGTTLANFEVAQGYKDIPDLSATVKFPLEDEPGTALLVWTTTPWTLPGNTAAAVNAEATYVKVRTDEGFVILAKDLLAKTLGDGAKVYEEMKGKDLVGKRYEPPFAYFKESLHKHKTHAFRVYAAPFVTLEDGTGIVHIAPAFGADDLELSQKEKIPLIQHVTDEGTFIATVSDFAHMPVKPKGRHMETDEKIIENLRSRGLLFASEKITHSYPHCWRCDTPLLNWAANSWFVAISKIKRQLLAENPKINWVPEHIGTGRFQKGIEGAPDWAISRSRFWGAPIPVWRHSKSKELRVVGSVAELLSMVRRSGNRYFVMRHGESRSNVENFVNSDNALENHLTDAGKKQARESATRLRKKGSVDLIVASPLVRAQETAALVREELGLPLSAVMTDERLRETGVGIYNGKPLPEWKKLFSSYRERFAKAAEGGETYTQTRRRVGEFLFDLERRYAGKNILIVTHGSPAFLMAGVASRYPLARPMVEDEDEGYLRNGEVREISFVPFPHDDNYDLDLHRPQIDELPFGDSLHGEWKRVADVFDCWFESGAMPFASKHYPFEKKGFDPKRFLGFAPKGFPADFIAEGLDQTRGWFYSLIVLGTALFGKAPYKNVIVNGLILAENGQKMSKRLKNYPDPMDVVDQYSADSLRYYLLSSPVVRAEDLKLASRGVEEVHKKLIMRLDNVRSFYDLYADGTRRSAESPHALDRWIRSRLGELLRDTTAGFERFELDAAARPLGGFIDDLSTWYLRRSRDRFKETGEDKVQALATLRFALYTLSQAMAPVMPFFAEDLYQKMRDESDPESVHLCEWPGALPADDRLIADMAKVRMFASAGLMEREKAGIKVRQPLATLFVAELPASEGLSDILAEEVNVKAVVADPSLSQGVKLDTELTPELREEGLLRDAVRAVQDFRKKEKLTIGDRPTLEVTVSAEGEAFVDKFRAALMQETGLADLRVVRGEGEGELLGNMRIVQ